MRYSRLFTFIILLLCAFTAKADVFTVTSNADSGPGTLREALTLAAANGSGVKDFINFNFPDVSVAGRTITIATNLPDLSSNLAIDGSTQPGNKIGISDAKVILRTNWVFGTTVQGLYGKRIANIEIYAIYFTNFFDFGNTAAIRIWDSSNILIGNTGKGNAFGYTDDGVYILRGNNIKVSSNIFGLDLETNEPAYATYTSSLRVYASTPVVVGGDTGAEGNVFAFGAYDRPSLITGFDANTGGTVPIANCTIKNNTFGFKANSVGTTGQYYFKAIKNLLIENNIYNYDAANLISDVSGMVEIKGNITNLNAAHQPDLQSTSNTPFYLFYVTNAIVGGPAPGDANIINNGAYNNYNIPAVYSHHCDRVRLQRNSFSCKTTAESFKIIESEVPVPVISISNIDNGIITGTATPGAEVEIFSDSQCQLCEPSKYLASVTADASGSWQYITANQSIGYTASATIDGRTSMFAKVAYDDSKLVKINPSCGKSNGSITGLKLANSTRIEWKNAAGTIVGTNLDVSGLPAGDYKFTAYLSDKCSITSNGYTLVDATPVINDANISVSPNSCSGNDGSIGGLYIENSNVASIQSSIWRNQSMVIAGRDLYLKDVPGGVYTLTVTTTNGCEVTYGPVNLANASVPVIVESSYTTTPSDCNSPTGAIHGIYATGGTGTLKYSWRNAQDQEVSTSADPTNQYSGKYRLRVTDESNCAPVYSSEIEILESNGVSLDLTGQGGRSATCNQNNGSITGLKAPGATAFEWAITGTATNVGHLLDLTGVPAGFYTLTISNTTCSKSYDFEVAGFPPAVFTGITYTSTKSCQAFNTGTLTANTDNANAQPLKYRWVNSAGENVGFDKLVQFLPSGTYKLYLTDNNYCENLYRDDYVVAQYPEFNVTNFGTVTNTQCGVGIGGVSGIAISGGTGNYTYQWLDADNNDSPIPGKNQPTLTDVLKGHYKLRITDGGCSLAEIPYTIIDEAVTPPSPSANNIQVYNTGPAVIKVNSPFPTAIYRIYETATSPQPIKDTIGGNIKINVTESRSYYVSLTYGYCESARTEVKVFLSALNGNIPNTFTPNGDGINDYWNIPGLDTYPNAKVNIFNRYGTPVFQSIGYAKPFDGTSNGKPLPVGVYYYIITLKKGDVLSGNVTIIR